MKLKIDILQWRLQVFFVRCALFLIRAAGPVRLGPELHQFFADRYLRLAGYHRRVGHIARASRLFALAALHWRAQDPESPPPTVATIMPVPLPPLFTWLVASYTSSSRHRKAA